MLVVNWGAIVIDYVLQQDSVIQQNFWFVLYQQQQQQQQRLLTALVTATLPTLALQQMVVAATLPRRYQAKSQA